MFGNMFNAILNSDIIPQVNGTFWSGLGNGLLSIGSWILQGIATIFYTIIKYALGLIDFMQFLVQKLAGLDYWMNIEKIDVADLQENDIVFRFLFSETVVEVMRTMFTVFLVLLIVFTIFAIIKNEYASASSGGDVKDHKKSWIAAGKAILTVILVPILLIGGIVASNAILASIARAFNINGNLSLGGQIFVASAYDASSYRFYAKQGVRKPTSNKVNFEINGNPYRVNAALTPLDPDSIKDNNKFTGYMFTYNGSDYFLWKCSADEADAYYYYIKYILGAAVVEPNSANFENPTKESVAEYNTSFAKDYVYADAQDMWGLVADYATEGARSGFISASLEMLPASNVLIDAAYNTWSYNQILETNISDWANQSMTLEINSSTFLTKNGSYREAFVVQNSDSWGKLHDGGANGFSPLAVEYEVMADVIDFMIEYGVALYYVNAGNANINWQGVSQEPNSGFGNALYDGNVENNTWDFGGLLVDYKDEGRVAYEVKDVISELDGATYIVCYLDHASNQYVPLANNTNMFDAKGYPYKFYSGKYSADYVGPVVARAMFKNTNKARTCEPTYITSTMVAGVSGTDFDSKLATAVQMDFLNNSGLSYTYLKKISNATTKDIILGQSYADDDFILSNGKFTYFIEPTYSAGQSQAFVDAGRFSELANNANLKGRIESGITQMVTSSIVGEEYKYVGGSYNVSDDGTVTFQIVAKDKDANHQRHTVMLTLVKQSTTSGEVELTKVNKADKSFAYKVLFAANISLEKPNQDPPVAIAVNSTDDSVMADKYVLADNGEYIKVGGDYILYEDYIRDNEGYESDIIENPENAYDRYNKEQVRDIYRIYEMINEEGKSTFNWYIAYDSGKSDSAYWEMYRGGSADFTDNSNAQHVIGLILNNLNCSVVNANGYAVDGNGKMELIVHNANLSPYSKQYKLTLTFSAVSGTSSDVDINSDGIDDYKYSIDVSIEAAYPEETTTLVEHKKKETLDLTKEKIYYIENDAGMPELFYVDTQDAMIGGLKDSVEKITEGFKDLLSVGHESGDSPDVSINSWSYSGGVEFSANPTNTLQIMFSARIPDKDGDIYVANFVMNIVKAEKTDTSADGHPLYKYIFNYSVSVYNTFNAYRDDQVITNEGTNEAKEFTISDLTRVSGTKNYMVYQDFDNGKEKIVNQSVVQFTYNKIGTTDSTVYTFNAVRTGIACDDGLEFITGNYAARTFTPNDIASIGYDEDLGVSLDALDYERNLVFSMVKIRLIYMPEFSYIEKQEGSSEYGYYIIDVKNTKEDVVRYYKFTFDKNAEAIDLNSISAKAFEYHKADRQIREISEETINKLAKEYIKEHFSMQTYYVDLHGYQELKKTGEVESVPRYTATLETDQLRSFIFTATNARDNEENVGDTQIVERLKLRSQKFGEYLVVANIDHVEYKNANVSADIERDLEKLLKQPASIVFCRDEMDGKHFMFDFKIHIWSQTEGFNFLWRGPKLGFATIQKSSTTTDNVVLSLASGKVNLNYNFSGNVKLGHVYLVTDLNWIILVFAIVIIFGILGKAVWGLVGRVYQITLLFLIMPAVASTLPIDEKGSRFDSWKSKMISQVLGAYGVTIGLNFFFILIPVIRDASAIFTEADIAGMTDTMRLFAGSADRLNYLCYVLFLLVAFTLLKTVPSLVQEFTGFKDGEVIKQGEDVKKNVTSTVEEVGSKVSNVVSGANILGAVKSAKEFGQGLIPGKAIYDTYKAKQKEKEKAKKAAEEQAAEERKQQNQQYAMENAKKNAEEARERMQKAKEAQTVDDASAEGEAKATKETNETAAGVAQLADGLTAKAKAEIIEEATSKSQEFADAAMQVAEAAMEAADAQFGNVHDYVGDKEKEEEERRAQAEAEKQFRKTGEGKALTKLEEAQKMIEEGKAVGTMTLSKSDIENWNKTHGEDEQIKKIKESDFENSDAYREARRKQMELRYQAKQDKYLQKLESNLQDEREGIHHGIGASVVRKVIGGSKTWQQRVKEAENLERAQEKLKDSEADQKYIKDVLVGKAGNATSLHNITDDRTAQLAVDKITGSQAGKKIFKKYEEQFNNAANLDEKKALIKQMKAETVSLADKNLQKAQSDVKRARAKVDETQKGMLYTAGKYGKKAVKPITDKAEVVGKWIANKGRTFLYGHTDQDKKAAEALLAKRAEKAETVTNLEKELEDLKNNRKVDPKQQAFMDKYIEIKAKKNSDKELFEHLKNNKEILKDLGFVGQEGLPDNFYYSGKKGSGKDWSAAQKQKILNSFDSYYKNNPDLLNKKSTKEIKAKELELRKAKSNLALFEAENNNSLKKAEQMLNGKHVRSIGVVGEAKRGAAAAKNLAIKLGNSVINSKVVTGTKKIAKTVAESAKNAAKQAWNYPLIWKARKQVEATIDDAKYLAKGVYKYTGAQWAVKQGVKAYQWNQDRLASKAAARAATKEKQVENAEQRRARNAHIEQIIGQEFVRKEEQTKQEIIEKLEKRLKHMQEFTPFHSGLKVSELEKLLEKYKKDSEALSAEEKLQMNKYLKFAVPNKNVQLEQMKKTVAEHAQKVSDRKDRTKLITELEQKTKRIYLNELHNGLADVGISNADIRKIVDRVKRGTTTAVYKQTRVEVEKIINEKYVDLLNNADDTTQLNNEVRKLKAIVKKLQQTDSAYKVQMKKVQLEAQKTRKELKAKKAADARQESQRLQTDNPFGGGSNKN